MLLHFLAREGLVREPDCAPRIGQAARFMGRSFVPASKTASGKPIPASHPATEEGFECEADSDIGRHAVKHARKGAFWPGNEETAKFCGVPFTDIDYDPAGLWTEVG